LRRTEAAELSFEHIQQREGRWAIVDLIGKHGRIRTVPMPSWAKVAIDAWAEAAAINSGRVFRAINKGGRITHDTMTPQSIFEAVLFYAARIRVKVAPHDLRRTYAKLAHKGRAALEQIQLSLGHASIMTTERYLGVRQDLTDAPCDRLGLRLAGADL
jgi:integrase